ncbi:acetyltransferase [Arenibacter sp. BSSL-BM3]|uniref:Acetyltransferase n=1 Tax=Arenibacter arenosicollis TaxID=2762274 RepID=A0ABR7QIM3_9FLAO|nr:acetyltransferase [Arenibacter arenosicollis]
MLESKKIHILGYSGHAYVVIDIALSNNLIVQSYFDKLQTKINPYDLVYSGSETEVDIKSLIKSDHIFPAVGSNSLRTKLITFIEEHDLNQTTLIALSAYISPLASVGLSTLIGPKVIVNSMASIGTGCIINSGAIIEHECKVEDLSHIAPGCVLAGNVTIGNNSFIGANSVVKNGVKIGKNVIVGAGAVVINNIPDNETWVGNPAKRIR